MVTVGIDQITDFLVYFTLGYLTELPNYFSNVSTASLGFSRL